MIENINEKKVTKDAPKERSCIILPQRSASLMPPPIPIAVPASLPMQREFSTVQNKIPRRLSGESIKKKIDNDNKSMNTIFCWKVKKIEKIPKIHLLERTHVFVPDASAQDVARRITDCFQKESIKANFDDLRAIAKGETIEHIHFVVRLFATDCPKQVVVEIQRVLGCSYRFNQIAKNVLNAAKGIRQSHPSNKRTPLQMNQNTLDQCIKKESITKSLEISLNMLRSNMFDTNLLALDILLQLTSDSNNTNSAYDRSFAAKKILSNPLLKNLLLQTLSTTPTITMKHQHSIKMRRHALTILANCLDTTEKFRNLERNDVFYFDKLCLSLFEELKASSTKPHEAYQAARCLHSIFRSHVQVKKSASIQNVADTTLDAVNKGAAFHSMLEKEVQKLRISLCKT